MDDVKVCPRCDAEYYAHVNKCATCGVELVAPGNLKQAKQALPDAAGELVCVVDGPRDRVLELSATLKKAGFAAQHLKVPDADGGCSTDKGYGVFVPKTQAQAAVKKVEGMWHELHPEMVEAQDRMNAGLCPACGTALRPDNPECPDCGLFLGDPSCQNDPDCGSCD
ncbi:MAG: hypothetical protein HZB85_10725 [Deltaproteobacteria bacterium]|nr:hypothetical protein [Deltaproteobacteria bacterium]